MFFMPSYVAQTIVFGHYDKSEFCDPEYCDMKNLVCVGHFKISLETQSNFWL